MTYTELVAQIGSYTENTYPTVDVNTFITQAENRIFNSVNLPDLRRNDTGGISAANKYLNVPLDWLATYSLAVIDNATNEYTFLLNKDVNFIRQSFPDTDATHFGKPQYYAVFDDETFILGPTPDINYGAELHYFFYPESITTATSGKSWLGDNYSTALLYGSLLEANTYLMSNAEKMSMLDKRYNEAMVELLSLGEGKNTRDAYRSGQARIPVKGKRGAA
jgi:hypothetical protein|tara:strand:+ start:200 stop:862 length:663 start_codon:yes stop_codon:yes gene_type:complete